MADGATAQGSELRIGDTRISPHQLACMEVWGGNVTIETPVELPGLRGWIYSKPQEPATAGGDVYYLSVCSQGMLSRIVLADVSGHGQGVGPLAVELRHLVHKHINTMDQSDLMRGINEAFSGPAGPGSQYATAAVLGYYSETRDLVFANAGHPPLLWYHADRGSWDWLREENPSEENAIEGLPLGLIAGTKYSQTAVRLGEGDRLVLYTDGVTECVNDAGAELGYEGLISIARSLTPSNLFALGPALLSGVQAYSAAAGRLDDVTLLVLGV